MNENPGLSPLDVVELRNAMDGIAELMGIYFAELRKHGFRRSEAFRMVLAWQAEVIRTGGREQGA